MQKLEQKLKTMKFEKAGPVSSGEIQKHENALGLKFGAAYKRFVTKYGCIVAGANEIYGVCGNNASIPSAIHATESARRDPKFPKSLLVIGDDGSGRKFCVDSRDDIFVCDRSACVKSGQKFEEFAVEMLGA